MNINVIRFPFASGISVGYQPVQLPNYSSINSVTLMNASGSTGPVYIGTSNVTWQTGFPLYVERGFTTPVENPNLLYAVCESGYTSDLRIFAG